MLLLYVTSIKALINCLNFLHTESALQPEGLLHTRGMAPVWLIILSDQLEIVALVGRYPTN